MKIIIATSTVNEVNDIVAPAYTDLANKVGDTDFKAEFLKREIDVFKYWNISKQDGNTVLEINDEFIITLAKYFAVAAEFAGGMYAMFLALGLSTVVKKGFGLMDRLTGMLKAKKASSTVKEESPMKPMAKARSIHAAVVKANGVVEDLTSLNTGTTRLAAIAILSRMGKLMAIGFRDEDLSPGKYTIGLREVRMVGTVHVLGVPMDQEMVYAAPSLQSAIDAFNKAHTFGDVGDDWISDLVVFQDNIKTDEVTGILKGLVASHGAVVDLGAPGPILSKLAAAAVFTAMGRSTVIGFRQSDVSSGEYAIGFCSIRSRCGSLVMDAPETPLLPRMFGKADSLQAVIDQFNLYNQTDGPGDTRIEGLITFN